MNLLLTDREELVSSLVTGSSIGCSNHANPRSEGRLRRESAELGLRKANFSLCKELVVRIPWKAATKGLGTHNTSIGR